jgi:type I restriction enzyme S subunit
MRYSCVPLGGLVTISGGGTPSRNNDAYWGGSIPWATVKDLKDTSLSGTQETITPEGLRDSASNLIPAGSVIVATRMGLGKVAINTIDVTINQDLKAFSCSASLDPRYLVYYLLVNASHLDSMGKGATVKGITLDVLKDLSVPLPPLPPLPEQKRIAAILDKADSIRRKRQEAVRLTEELLRSKFLDMFGDPVTNPRGWEEVTIRDLATEVKYGTSDKASYDGKYPVLRMNNITYSGGWNFTDLKRIDIPEKELSKYLVRKGDILFNRTNSKELVGKTAVYRRDEPMAYAGYLIRIRPNKHNNSEYIAAYLNSTHGKKYAA